MGCLLQNLEEVLREEPNAKFYRNKSFAPQPGFYNEYYFRHNQKIELYSKRKEVA